MGKDTILSVRKATDSKTFRVFNSITEKYVGRECSTFGGAMGIAEKTRTNVEYCFSEYEVHILINGNKINKIIL